MLDSKFEVKKLDVKDVDWIMEYAHEYISRKNLEDSFKYNNLSVATRMDGVVASIIVMIVGDGKNYVSLLWTNGSYGAIREAMVFFRDLAKTTRLLFHSQNKILFKHRKHVIGDKTNKTYFEMVA